jgi:hypothetical protein
MSTEVLKYRKKPVVIEAMRLTLDTFDDVVHWIRSNGGQAHRNAA